MTLTADIAIIGAGMAGVSLAGRLAGRASVVLLEMEDAPGYHSSGRSAANWEPAYGPPVMRALTVASRPFLDAPPEGFATAPLLTPRGAVMIGFPGDEPMLAEGLAVGYRETDRAEIVSRIPILKAERAIRYLIDDNCLDIDVDALLQGFLRLHRRAGGRVVTRAGVEGGRREGTGWRLQTAAGVVEAGRVVICAGAWSDQVAQSLGARPVGLQPKRRSAAIVPGPKGYDIGSWPQLFPAGEVFYCKPTGGKWMVSPADATPVDPHDAWADDELLAGAMAVFEELLDQQVTRVERTWGGLRTFAPDGDPVVGFDPQQPGLFWLAGQGGYGIQTSAALSELAASLVLGEGVPGALRPVVGDATAISPARFDRRS